MSVDTPSETAPPPAPPRRPRWVVPLLAAVAVVLATAVAVTAWALTRAPAAPAAVAPARSASPECVAVTRAYQAWDSLTLPQSIDGLQLDSTELSLKMAMDDGKAFLGDVTGYDDHASKVLANSVATFNADLGMANVMFTLSGEIERDQAVTVMTSLEQVRMDYLAWRKATCL